jgi:hypothetical protein
MATERRRQLILAALVVVLLSVIYRLYMATTSPPATASNRSAAAAAARSGAAGRGGRGGTATGGANDSKGIEAPDVHLEALNAERAEPEADRNLFRFRPKAPPPAPPPPPPGPVTTTTSVPAGPPPPPPVPPINLKFIGILDVPGRGQKIAALSDGRNTFHGVEGDIIEGRYRILKIGVESIEIAYVDGRGRQTIRLTGS